MRGAVAAFETEKKKTSVRIFYWCPDMHGYYHSAGVQDVMLMTLSCMVVLIGILCIIGVGPDRKKGRGSWTIAITYASIITICYSFGDYKDRPIPL